MKIKVIKVMDDTTLQSTVGNIYEVNHVDKNGTVITECGRYFYKEEYKILNGEMA